MKLMAWLFTAFVFATSSSANAAQKQVKICGAQTETHISGTNTPHNNDDGNVHASGATTPAATKAAPEKKTSPKEASRQQPGAGQEFNDGHPAPGEVRKPRQPRQATVESPRSPTPPRAPDAPGGK